MSWMKLDPGLNLPSCRKPDRIEANYGAAREQYAELGVDTDTALKQLRAIPISLHCWQGDDVGGFEGVATRSAADWPSPATTPARPGRRSNCEPTLTWPCRLIPGRHRFNLHASYAETGRSKVERNELEPSPFPGLDRLGHGERNWAWTSTRRSLPTRRPTTASR